jgi:uncharacterized protein affecting Mg2+/Co2+ transport
VAITAPVAVASQYHSQDEAGQYSFGYTDGTSDRQEVKTADGIVRGAYHYVDTNGLVQTVEYIADDAGFRVAGTNLPVHVAAAPVDTPEVEAAKAQHALLYSQAAAEAALQPVEEEAAAEGSGAVVALEAGEPETYYGAAVTQPLPVVSSNSLPVQSSYYGAAVVPYTPVTAPAVVPSALPATQYHSQDELGQYSYGYSDANSEKQEIKTADGIVRGSYRYVDSDGLVQTVNYISDALGFRVGATNLPVHVIPAAEGSPVAAAEVPAAAFAAEAAPTAVVSVEQPVVAAAYNSAPVLAPQVSYAYLPYASGYSYNIPVPAVQQYVAAEPTPAAAQPVVTVADSAAVPAAVAVPNDVNSQYHAQDELGQYNYGYASPTQTKAEVKTADGIVRGAYSYVDANGIVQTVNYISDAMGFRVAATNLPVHVVEDNGAAVADGSVAVVEAAKLKEADTTTTLLTPQVAYAYLPYAQSYAYNTPIGIAA